MSLNAISFKVNPVQPALYHVMQVLLITFHAYNKVRLVLYYCFYYFMLTTYGIYCHYTSFQIQGLNKFRNSFYLIAFLSNFLLIKSTTLAAAQALTIFNDSKLPSFFSILVPYILLIYNLNTRSSSLGLRKEKTLLNVSEGF